MDFEGNKDGRAADAWLVTHWADDTECQHQWDGAEVHWRQSAANIAAGDDVAPDQVGFASELAK